MKTSIDRDGCIGCGLCADSCPAVYQMNDDGYAEVIVDVVPSTEENSVQEAADGCPVGVISVD